MKTIIFIVTAAIAAISCPAGLARASGLTLDIPECRMPPGRVMPAKYYRPGKNKGMFHWVRKVTAGDYVISEGGSVRVEGSGMDDWYSLYRIDVNSDAICDWYLNASAPISTGGDRDSINTMYLGGASGWSRVGAEVPLNKPDGLGYGKSAAQQHRFLFGEEPSVIHDAGSKTNYIIAALYSRHVRRDFYPGYRIFDWDAGKKTLRLLDKWEPGSRAAEVYAFFKAHGSRAPAAPSAAPEDSMNTFDPDVEAHELEMSCDPEGPQRSSPDQYGAVSRHLLARCEQ